jgi:hypothetical protein
MKRTVPIIIATLLFQYQALPQVKQLFTHAKPTEQMKFSPDGRYLATFCRVPDGDKQKAEIKLWSTETAELLTTLNSWYMHFSADSRYFASYIPTKRYSGVYYIIDLKTLQRKDSIPSQYDLYCFYADTHSYIGFDRSTQGIVFIDPDDPAHLDIEPIPALKELNDPMISSIYSLSNGTVFLEVSAEKKKGKSDDRLELIYSYHRRDADAKLLYKGKRGSFAPVFSPGGKYLLAGAEGDLIDGTTGEMINKGFGKYRNFTDFGTAIVFCKGDSLIYDIGTGDDFGIYRVDPTSYNLKSSSFVTGSRIPNNKGLYPVAINTGSGLYAYQQNETQVVYIGRTTDGIRTVALDDAFISAPVYAEKLRIEKEKERERESNAYNSSIAPVVVTPGDNISSLQVGSWFKFGNGTQGDVGIVTRISNGEVYFKFNDKGAEEKMSNYSLLTMHILRASDVSVCSSCKGGLKNCWYCGGKGKTPVAGRTNITTEVHDHQTWYYTIETTTTTGPGWETCKFCKGNGKERILYNHCNACGGRGWVLK